MKALLRPSMVAFLLLSALTGVVYPIAVTVLGQLLFPRQARGSLLFRGSAPVGSSLIGQRFEGRGYFWGRPSATTPAPYTAFDGIALSGSSGSNLGPTNPATLEAVKKRVDAMRAAHGAAAGTVPVDLATASASGLDPHISPAAALYQADRVAEARNLPRETVLQLVELHTEGRFLGLLGEPVVNVLELNLALDALSVTPR